MARVRIDLPNKFTYSTRLQVPVGDLAGGHHLGNHVLISYFNEVLFQFLRDTKLSELFHEKTFAINTDLALIYTSESSHWDMLKFDMAVCPSGQSGFDLYFRVTNETTGREAAIAKMGMLFFDYELQKTCKVPEEFKIAFC
jgi:acyl-CoA thioesterase FadM